MDFDPQASSVFKWEKVAFSLINQERLTEKRPRQRYKVTKGTRVDWAACISKYPKDGYFDDTAWTSHTPLRRRRN